MQARQTSFSERITGECLKIINTSKNAEDALRQLLKFLGETLSCSRVYVFEVIDRQHLRNTYEWYASGVKSGIEALPYLVKKDLAPWYERLASGGDIILPEVEALREDSPLIYEIMREQEIHSLVLSPMFAQGEFIGFFGADNPPDERLESISALLDVLAHFVCSLVTQRELVPLREKELARKDTARSARLGKTVMLIDDSPELLHINKRVLYAQGFDIICAGSVAEANDRLAESRPDLIVSDVDLPDGTGIDFCRRIREDGVQTPVIFLSARSDAEALQSAEMSGGCAFLTKPYRIEDLQDAVASALEEKAPSSF